MRRPLIAGNWKMFNNAAEATALINALKPLIDTAKIIIEGREDMDKKVIDGPKPYGDGIEKTEAPNVIDAYSCKV